MLVDPPQSGHAQPRPKLVPHPHIGHPALAGIPLLVTSDKHLLNADAEGLALAFQDADLPPVQSPHPKALARALG